MLDIKYIREHLDEVRENAKSRNVVVDVDALARLDDERLTLIKEVEDLRRERNEIAAQTQKATPEERTVLVERGKELKNILIGKEQRMEEVLLAWRVELMRLPNMTHPDSPSGASDEENKEIKQVGEVAKLDFPPLSHVQLAEKHDLIDFTRGAKVAGAKFYFLKGKLVLLEQALVQWALHLAAAEGFMPMTTPDLAKDEVLVGTGFQPRGPEAQIYSIQDTDLSLVGTAEIPLGGYHKDEILEEEQLPIKYVGLSHCFRTEAGTYGRESYGLYRVHQFTKVELFIFAGSWQSEALHEQLRALEEHIFTKLGIPFRVVDICTGDLGGPAYRKYDLEAWMWGRGDGKGGWGEVTSASNCTDYQARRLNVRVRRQDGTVEYAHTLNGTAVALSRALIAILENGQQADGSIVVPDVLRPYCGFDRIG